MEHFCRNQSKSEVKLKILQNSQENNCARVSFLIKLQAEACNFSKKETLTQVFSCQFWEIFKKTFFHRTPPVAASERKTIQCITFQIGQTDFKNLAEFAQAPKFGGKYHSVTTLRRSWSGGNDFSIFSVEKQCYKECLIKKGSRVLLFMWISLLPKM